MKLFHLLMLDTYQAKLQAQSSKQLTCGTPIYFPNLLICHVLTTVLTE